jgi:hypothetical protein
VISALGVSFALSLSGCISVGHPLVLPGEFEGPALSVESGGAHHTIAMTAPSAGWTMFFDRATRHFDRTEVFITIARPDPAYLHAQGEVRQYLDSTIDSREPTVIFARVVEHGAKSGSYQRAAASAPMPSPAK